MNLAISCACKECGWFGGAPVFLISLKASGTGLTLTAIKSIMAIRCPECDALVVEVAAEDYDFEKLHQELVEKIGDKPFLAVNNGAPDNERLTMLFLKSNFDSEAITCMRNDIWAAYAKAGFIKKSDYKIGPFQANQLVL